MYTDGSAKKTQKLGVGMAVHVQSRQGIQALHKQPHPTCTSIFVSFLNYTLRLLGNNTVHEKRDVRVVLLV